MVWFYCECGESLKKPKVAKHLTGRNCSYLSCVDCSNVFYGEDYYYHDKCVSEEEKYQGKLYNKKEKMSKQELFLDNIRQYIHDKLYKDADDDLKWYFDTLLACDNIPRKEKAFKNFCSNVLGKTTPSKVVTTMWKAISDSREYQSKKQEKVVEENTTADDDTPKKRKRSL